MIEMIASIQSQITYLEFGNNPYRLTYFIRDT